MRNRRLQFRFCFPPIYGIYDTGEGLIYVFGEQDGKIEDVLGHEALHWAVHSCIYHELKFIRAKFPVISDFTGGWCENVLAG